MPSPSSHPQALTWWTAIEHNRLTEFELLCATGFPVELRNLHGETAMQLLTRDYESRGVEWLDALMAAGAKINYPRTKQDQPLYLAVDSGYASRLIQVLLDRGADPHLAMKRHPMMLHKAVLNCAGGVVKLLLDAGVDPNAKSPDPRSPLQIALLNGTKSAQYLIEAGADIHQVELGVSKLGMAVCMGNPGPMQALLERGADPTFVDNQGLSVLDRALPEYQELIRAAIEAWNLQRHTPPAPPSRKSARL